MDALKSLYIILFLMINSICHAIEIECSICHERFDRKKGTSENVCPDCKELITAVKIWKQGCAECRKYTWIDLCPNCLDSITKQDGSCKERHHKLYNMCIVCLKIACQNNKKYDGKESPNCCYNECTNPIATEGCCGYPTGLCSQHNASLRQAIKNHKSKCKEICKSYPLLDLCPECLNLINHKKSKHTECIWAETPYDVYVPCETCLACYACE